MAKLGNIRFNRKNTKEEAQAYKEKSDTLIQVLKLQL
jgi:predicted nucleotidyltransferase